MVKFEESVPKQLWDLLYDNLFCMGVKFPAFYKS